MTCELGTLLSGGSAVVVTPLAPGEVSTTVVASGDAPDPGVHPNTATTTTSVAAVAVIPALSGWGTVVLAGTIATALLWSLRRRRTITGV